MKKISPLAGAALLLGALAASAQTVTDNGTTNVIGQTILLDDSDAHVGYPGLNMDLGEAYTDGMNVASFSDLTGFDGLGTDSAILTTSLLNDEAIPYSATPNFTFTFGTQTLTTTLFAPSETFSIYVSTFQSNAEFTFTIGQFVLQVTPTLFTQDGDHFYALESITVTGTIGDTLTIEQRALDDGNVGINAITVEVNAIPESGTWVMLLGGLGMLAAWQRRTRRAR